MDTDCPQFDDGPASALAERPAPGDGEPFRVLIGRVRGGDPRAAEELVRRYEPAIRRVARVRLTDPRLRRQLDSADVCQSVLASFFVRAAGGQYELDTPDELLRLLATMTRNKLASQARRQRTVARDYRRLEARPVEQAEAAGREASPSRQASARELLEEVGRRLSDEERRLLELRERGLGWTDVALELGGSAEALRKRLARALGRVAREIGWDDPDDG